MTLTKKIPDTIGLLKKTGYNFLDDNMKRTGSYRYVYSFSVDYCSIGVAYSLDLYKHILKKHDMKYCLDLLKKFY